MAGDNHALETTAGGVSEATLFSQQEWRRMHHAEEARRIVTEQEADRLRALLADVGALIEAGALLDTVAGKNFRDSRVAAAIREELDRGR